MPTYDGGHCYLTVLAPIRGDLIRRADGTVTSCLQGLRETLSTLPTAQHSPVTVTSAKKSPFARCRAIHLARFVVVDDLPYNGRAPENVLTTAITRTDPLITQPVDRLNADYLLFAAEIDASDPTALDEVLHRFWDDATTELRSIFVHCQGFEDVKTGAEFVDYIRSCQIETTMPFNDYWRESPLLPSLTRWTLLAGGGIAWLAASGALYATGRALALSGGLWMALGVVLGLAVAVAFLYSWVMWRGGKPFPAAPDSDLPSILKALYLQQKFTRFAIDAQADDDASLHARFAAFLTAHEPSRIDRPTQVPGVVQS